MCITRYVLLCFICFEICFTAIAQPGTTIDLKKPEKYQNRTLGSEKTTDQKINKGKKFYQNIITHYNYYFNANERVNQIIERAKQGFKDDYTKLLPYYNYNLDVTATDPDIDSVIYKCNAGILLHDLRNDWVDDLYFLMGKAYFLRKDFDSAGQVFSYINYSFAPKDEGYDLPIGSSATNSEFSISTKEKKTWMGNPPRRNEDLVWIAKNYIEEGKANEAASILQMLKNDPNFPERLQPELNEVMGYLYYQSKLYDSAAIHLAKATAMDESKQDKARREYLTGQLYILTGDKENAEKYFIQSAEHTVDPYLAVYASLNAINASPDTADRVQKKIASLMKLAKKDRYVAYRDLIYFTASQVSMQDNNFPQAYSFAQKSVKYNLNNPVQRSRSFMLMGDLDYLRPDYEAAKHDYDSVDMSSLENAEDQQRLTLRLTALQEIAANIAIIKAEDSLQNVARMPEAQRVAYVKKMVRQLRKAKGLQEDDTSTFVNPAVQLNDAGNNNASSDLFAAQAAAKGDWYFNNNALKSSGFNAFRATWGNRPDVDNWRRIDAVSKQIAAANQGNPDAEADTGMENQQVNTQPLSSTAIQDNLMNGGEITYDALMAYLPLTEDKMKESNDKIMDALFKNGQQFQNELEDYNAAINSYDTLLKRFPENTHLEEVLYDLFYCYTKLGRKVSADSALSVLNIKFKNGKYANMLSNPPATNFVKEEDAATKEYERIYDLFIEGKFEEAKAAKVIADSLYGNSYWTPQLLYIESIYFVTKHDDSIAIETLTQLNTHFASSPLAQKAQTMIDVLRRRPEIEAYLTNLQITRLPDDEPSPVVNLNPVENIFDKKEIKKDSIITKAANKEVKANVDTMKTVSGTTVKTFVFNSADQQFAGIILYNVDPVYANETKNAFNRYNKINFYNQKINVTSSKINDSLSIVLLGPFVDAASALIYINKVKPNSAGTIIPWLKTDKYGFTIISQANLDILNDTKDIHGYKALIEKVLPGRF